ncbi:LysR family transcriptional regulator, partial [Acinetobacter baumannii]
KVAPGFCKATFSVTTISFSYSMSSSLPPLKALKVFEAAVRTRSLTLAAHELFITHSAVSQQIKTLEEYFEQPLFLRQSRGVEPTEA